MLRVRNEVTPHDIAQASFEAADRFSWGVAFGELAVVVGAAGAVAVTDLGDRRGVQRVVESAVAAPGDNRCVVRPPEENSIGAVPV